ncbi:MAG: Lrp/AsnC family transcriptional regulator [Candidatus Hodarchaeota archaeon]
MINEKLKLDDIDLKLISIVQEDPDLTHMEISKLINRSQPTVGTRLKKLREAGFLQFQAGVNCKKIDIELAFVNLLSNNPQQILKNVNECPFMIYAFKLSGNYNVKILLFAPKINKFDKIINHFRINPEVQRVSLEIITDISDDLIFPININSELLETSIHITCNADCKNCKFRKLSSSNCW